ncbi:MAG: energy transducer TonB [Prevotella sp.]|nr:energy transducer TonB [Prevotella sp.]
MSANIDDKRSTGLLLGFIVALALTLTALEWTTHTSEPEESADILEDLAQDLEALPALDQRDLVALQQPQQTVKTVVAENIVVTEDVTVELADAAEQSTPEWVPLEFGPDEFTEEPVNNEVLSPLALGQQQEPVLRVVEEYPEFPGGMMELMKWLTKNLQYPAYARQQKIQGTVSASFIINKDGTVADVKILKSVEASLDREALRVLKMMPAWKPGKDRGLPCRTLVRIPIVFKI